MGFLSKVEAKVKEKAKEKKAAPSVFTPFNRKLTDLKEVGYIDYGSYTEILLYSPKQRRFFLEISKQRALGWLSRNRDRIKDYLETSEATRHLPFIADDKSVGNRRVS